MSRNETYIFIDIEATLIHGRQNIIEIGAVKWLPDGTIEKFERLIRPSKFKKLNHHIQKLTGITTDEILSASSFDSVIQEFIRWCQGNTIFVTFGEFDRKVLEEELTRHHINKDFLYPIVDFQQKYMIDHHLKDQPSLSGLMSSLKLEVKTQHRALADAYSLLNIFVALDGITLIEKQRTNEFALLLSEMKQKETVYEVSFTLLTGIVSNKGVSELSIESLTKSLHYNTREVERISKEGELQKVLVNEVIPDHDMKQFFNSIVNKIHSKVLITRSGLKQISKIFRLHNCSIPKTEVMTLQQLLKDEDLISLFTMDGQSIAAYEKKLQHLINVYQKNIIDEFMKRNLFYKEAVQV
ncbi:hypothetical protein MTP04_15790 [Lysinibacillus sp. PLM2]|nr:hypothetical protein MTP04_15790 [Lysinibacillus sp. PLM2]